MGCARVAQPYAVHAKVVHLLSITLHFKCLVDNILGGPRAGGGPDPPFLYYSDCCLCRFPVQMVYSTKEIAKYIDQIFWTHYLGLVVVATVQVQGFKKVHFTLF